MDMDMDIDIDLGDIGDNNDTLVPEVSFEPTTVETAFISDATLDAPPTEVPAAYLEEVVNTVPHKLNVQGVDDLSTANLTAYASECFPDGKPSIEWINDTSVNFVFEDATTARQALAKLSSTETLEMDEAKARAARIPSSHPGTHLMIRLAHENDKKKRGARDASRYYLMHPEEEERNRRKPQRRRRRSDEQVETFDASMYDDDESALATRRNGRDARLNDRRRNDRDRDRSASPGRRRSPDEAHGRDERRRPPRNSGKELFASPALKAANNKAAANTIKKELFPLKAGTRADEAVDLFASKMTLPMLDGAADVDAFPLRSDAMYQAQKKQEAQGFSIKGTAGGNERSQGFSIRGAAGQKKSIKELFPDKTTNAGKELFGGRTIRRNKAADLFG